MNQPRDRRRAKASKSLRDRVTFHWDQGIFRRTTSQRHTQVSAEVCCKEENAQSGYQLGLEQDHQALPYHATNLGEDLPELSFIVGHRDGNRAENLIAQEAEALLVMRHIRVMSFSGLVVGVGLLGK
jgi:hypothetical protein